MRVMVTTESGVSEINATVLEIGPTAHYIEERADSIRITSYPEALNVISYILFLNDNGQAWKGRKKLRKSKKFIVLQLGVCTGSVSLAFDPCSGLLREVVFRLHHNDPADIEGSVQVFRFGPKKVTTYLLGK